MMGARVAIVTGASSGIGKATADLLTSRGVTTLRVSRQLPEGERTWPCDVRDERSVARVFQHVKKRYGRIDILVNSAGIGSKTGPLNLNVKEWEKVLRTNLIGSYLCCKYAMRMMQRQRDGRIVNISSIAGRWYSRGASVAYTSSKYAVIGLTRQLAAQVGARGIRVNCVCPSETNSDMLLRYVPEAKRQALADANPLRRLAEPSEVARVIGFLVSDEASYVNGAVVDVNGGLL